MHEMLTMKFVKTTQTFYSIFIYVKKMWEWEWDLLARYVYTYEEFVICHAPNSSVSYVI